jgi:hypothetical protein
MERQYSGSGLMEGSFEDNNEISVSGGGEFLIR